MRHPLMRFRDNAHTMKRRLAGLIAGLVAVTVIGFCAPAIAAQADAQGFSTTSIARVNDSKTVPTLVGWSLPDAIRTLKSHGLTYSIASTNGTKVVNRSHWTVTKQAPKAKAKAASGSKVALTVEKTSRYIAQQTRKFYSQNYGTFAKVTSSSSGTAYLSMPSGITAAVVNATYSGGGRFTIQELGAKGVVTGRNLVSATGSYTGSDAIGLSKVKVATSQLKITGKGSWSVTLAPISSAPIVRLPSSESGDRVSLYSGAAAIWNVSSPGATTFMLSQISSSSYPNLAVNETGNWKGAIALQPGPSVVEIHSSGSWTIH